MGHRCDPTGKSLCIYGQRWLGRGPYQFSTHEGACPCDCHREHATTTKT